MVVRGRVFPGENSHRADRSGAGVEASAMRLIRREDTLVLPPIRHFRLNVMVPMSDSEIELVSFESIEIETPPGFSGASP
jgi:hypothetical protein